MSIQLYTANNIEHLALEFANNSIKKGVFDTEVIIYTDDSVKEYLPIETARINKIFTNYSFIKLNDFLSSLHNILGIYNTTVYRQKNLTWIIFGILNDDNFRLEHPYLNEYYDTDETKLYQLANIQAKLFNQYMIYRPDYIDAWNKNEHIDFGAKSFTKHEIWQYDIWQKIKNINNSDLGIQKQDLLNKIKDAKYINTIKKVFSQISVFDIGLNSDFHLEILSAISEIIPVNMYSIKSNIEDITDLSIGKNIIFMNFGENEINNLKSISKNFVIHKHIAQLRAKQSSENTILSSIQKNIIENTNTKNISYNKGIDNSLEISSSYTPVREVEALYNYLLSCYEQDKNLQDKDIIVHVSDINKYATYIRAVFDNSDVHINYNIHKELYKGKDSISYCLEELLCLDKENFSSEHIMQLLECNMIKEKFQVKDISFIRSLVKKSNIRFGIWGKEEYQTNIHSWHYGVNNMILDYCIKGGQELLLENTKYYTHDVFEGDDAYDMLILKQFIDDLIIIVEEKTEKKTLHQWKEYTTNIINKFLHITDNRIDEYQQILNYLYSEKEDEDKSLVKIHFSTFKIYIKKALSGNTNSSRLISGSLNFCPIDYSFSLGCKVRAILGFNLGEFPRRAKTLSFDLMEYESRIGDKNIKNNDRNIFLRILLSTQNKLYLSYLGNNIRDNSSMQNSLFIDEVKTFINTTNISNTDIIQYLEVKHPLYSFSSRYFDKNEINLYTYHTEHKDIKNTINKKHQEQEINTIKIKDIINFCKDPFKYYYNNILNIYYNIKNTKLKESEIFELDNLEEYKLKSFLLKNEKTDYISDKAKKIGLLSLGNIGEIDISKSDEKISDLRNLYIKTKGNDNETSIDVDIEFESNIRIVDSIKSVYGSKHICINISKESSKAKHLIEAWIKHLLLRASNEYIDTYFLAMYFDQEQIFDNKLLSRNEAKDILEQIIHIFLESRSNIIAFSPQVSLYTYSKNKEYFISEDIDDKIKLNILDKIKKEGELAYGKNYKNEYISKEIEADFFNIWAGDYLDRWHNFAKLTKLLFEKIPENILRNNTDK